MISFFIGISYSLKSKEEIFYFFKYANIGIYFYLPLNLHFYLMLSKSKIKSWMLILNYLPAILLNIINFMGIYAYSDFIRYKGEWVATISYNNFIIYIYLIYIFIYLIFLFLITYRWWKNTNIKKEKFYSIFIILTINFSYFISMLMVVISPLYKIYDFQSMGLILFYLYIVGLYLLISMYRFMNLNHSIPADEILSNINDIVLILDLNLRIENANNKFKELFLKKDEKSNNKCFSDYIFDFENVKNKIIDMNGKINSFNYKIKYKRDDVSITTNSYIATINDKYDDLIGYIVISSEIKEIYHFQKCFKLTNRELEVIELIISGITNKDTSNRLNITERTVEAHLTNIYNKLNINNKIELTRITGNFNIKAF